MSVFETLKEVDVEDHITKKADKFNYLPWADAWSLLLDKYPDAQFYINDYEGLPYQKTDVGYFVKTTVQVGEISRSEVMPVLNNYNKPVTEPTCFDINNSIKRCLVKTIALFGLGLSLYQKEEDTTPGDEYTASQKEEFDEAIDKQDGLTLVAMKNDLGVMIFSALYNSFPKGKKTTMKNIIGELEKQGSPKYAECLEYLCDALNEDDQSKVLEAWEELTKRQKSALYKDLNETEQKKLTSIKATQEKAA